MSEQATGHNLNPFYEGRHAGESVDVHTARMGLIAALAAEREKVAALERELEHERLRLACCGVAALGYFDGCADEYRSASLDDVLALRARATTAEAEVARLRGVIRGAAHDEGCASSGLHYAAQIEQYCDCFKSEALKEQTHG